MERGNASTGHQAARTGDPGDTVARRKDHHLEVCLREDVGSAGPSTGLGGLTLEYDALPEVDLEAVDLSVTLLGRSLRAPLVIGAMTGGTERAERINRRLARAAARAGIGMALGSQRAMLVRPELRSTFAVREAAPDLPLLFANVGAVQLRYGVGASEVRRLIGEVGADALNFHLNPLQEAIQPEGDTRFAGLSERIASVVPELGVPVLAKEVGSGISARTARKLARLPLAGIEAAGTGGTSWARVESHRAPRGSVQAELGESLAGFGVPTAESVRACRRALDAADGARRRVVIASGGVRSAMDVAVGLALGADAVALAAPLLAAAEIGEEAVLDGIERLVHGLRVIAFSCGARTVEELRSVRVIGPLVGPEVRA